MWPTESQPLAHRSTYFGELCCIIRQKLVPNNWEMPLFVGRLLLKFVIPWNGIISDNIKRYDNRSESEAFARKLEHKYEEQRKRFLSDYECIQGEKMIPSCSHNDAETTNMPMLSTITTSGSTRIGGKKRPFDSFIFSDSVPKQTQPLDEVTKCTILWVEHLPEARKALLNDEFSIMKF